MKEWWKSIGKYISLFEVLLECNTNQQHTIRMGLSMNFYEVGDYEESINYGIKAIKSCRNVKGVHKYVALDQKAIGDIDAAKKTLSRAVLYEAPWDEENLTNNLQMLNKLS